MEKKTLAAPKPAVPFDFENEDHLPFFILPFWCLLKFRDGSSIYFSNVPRLLFLSPHCDLRNSGPIFRWNSRRLLQRHMLTQISVKIFFLFFSLPHSVFACFLFIFSFYNHWSYLPSSIFYLFPSFHCWSVFPHIIQQL